MVGAGTIVAGATVPLGVLRRRADRRRRLRRGLGDHGRRADRRGAVVRRAILDKNVVVPDGAQIGVDLELDRQRYHVSEGGVVVLGKSAVAQP